MDYVTLDGEKFDIDDLLHEDWHIYKQVLEYLNQSPTPGWVDFANFWTRLVVNLHKETPEIIEKPIFKICQDLECRLGIAQGYIEPEEIPVTEEKGN